MKTIFYTVETRYTDTGHWKEEKIFHPDYDYEERPVQKRFLWATWKKKTKWCSNQQDAEIHARADAIKLAKTLHYDNDVRVRKCTRTPGTDWWTLVWEDGEWKDC